jgi:hypothetical protein
MNLVINKNILYDANGIMARVNVKKRGFVPRVGKVL